MDFSAIVNALADPEPARMRRVPLDFSVMQTERVPGWDYETGIASSHHLGLDGRFNELHPYVSATRPTDWSGVDIGIGRTTNSEGKGSVFGGLRAEAGPWWAEGGLATGYSAAPVVPFGRVGVDLNNRLSLWGMPAYDGQNIGGVLGMNFNALEW